MNALRSCAAVFLLASTAACAGNRVPAEGPGGIASGAAVERFLQLASEQRYVEMGWVFGTESGPVIEQWPRSEVEQRMYAIARVLAHESYVLGPSSAEPGRIGRAERYRVTLQSEGRTFNVPITVVRGPGNRWFVEQVDLEAVTNVS